MTVPASPQSIEESPSRLAGCTVGVVVSPFSTLAPSDCNAEIMSALSRETKAPVSLVGSVARAERTSSRLVSDLEPGSSTVAASVPVATGAAKSAE